MRTAGDEVNLNDFFTLYLKLFKTSFHLQLNLIESLSSIQDSDDISNTHEKIEKVIQATKQVYEQLKQIPKINYKLNYKTLQRFCLRINQYVQYRITKSKCLLSQLINSQLIAFRNALHRLFTDINKDKQQWDQQESLSILFTKINQIQNKYLMKIIINLFKTYKKSQKSKLLIQQLLKIKIYKVSIKQQIKIENQVDQNKINGYNIDFLRKINQSHYMSRLRSRKTTFQKRLNIPSIRSNPISITSEMQRKFTSVVASHLILRNTQNIDEIQQSIPKKQTAVFNTNQNILYKKISDIVQFCNFDQNNKETQQNLLKKLTENNKDNFIMIHKFRKKKNKIKNKLIQNSQAKKQDLLMDYQARHQRSYTLDTTPSRTKLKKQQKYIGLPSLKRKNIKN